MSNKLTKKAANQKNQKKQPKQYESIYDQNNNTVQKLQQLKFREYEQNQIQKFIISNDEYKLLFLTGQSGTGKTSLIHQYSRLWKIKNYKIIYTNAMGFFNYKEVIQYLSKQLQLRGTDTHQDLVKKLQKHTSSKLIIILDEFENLFKGNDIEAFQLFQLSKYVHLIGINNNIGFLEVQELVNDILNQKDNIELDKNIVKLMISKSYNEKGGDMRSIQEVLNEIMRNVKDVKSNEQINLNRVDFQMKEVVGSLAFNQQLILIGLMVLLKDNKTNFEIDMQDLIRKVNEIKYKMSLQLNIDLEEEIIELQNYNFFDIREVIKEQMSFKVRIKKMN
ncbi:unnamed protein product [Paramecium sonneborni]|uniref:AAA+ ATPase domain-containing protein n=1 Tax=Paramecium sonneborni TaxID=65129 RepID=A0A8S1LWC7_9CILI|nr:unnamed protein product [Paramecium sonneborni]